MAWKAEEALTVLLRAQLHDAVLGRLWIGVGEDLGVRPYATERPHIGGIDLRVKGEDGAHVVVTLGQEECEQLRLILAAVTSRRPDGEAPTPAAA